MTSLLTKVRKKMVITAHRRVRSVLEGEYTSVFKGRSMDFDDLREYIPGDDIKDIDWKATARNGQVLVKRYVAIRKHRIMLIVDTGRSMSATAPSGESKRDVAVMAAGVIASIALKHADLVGLTAGDSEHTRSMPFKGSRVHAERVLQYMNSAIRIDGPPSDLTPLLDYVRRTLKRRAMLVIISDSLQFARTQEQLLRRLAAQHELMFIAIDDLDPSEEQWNNKDLYDVDLPVLLPTFIRRRRHVSKMYNQLLRDEWLRASRMLKGLNISNVRISSEAEVVSRIIRLLEDHKHAHR